MPEVTRQNIFAQAARKLRQDFEELTTIPHNLLKGNEAEKLVRKFLKEHLRRRFDVGAGFIIDFYNNTFAKLGRRSAKVIPMSATYSADCLCDLGY